MTFCKWVLDGLLQKYICIKSTMNGHLEKIICIRSLMKITCRKLSANGLQRKVICKAIPFIPNDLLQLIAKGLMQIVQKVLCN